MSQDHDPITGMPPTKSNAEQVAPAAPCSPDVVSWDRWKQTLDERDEARREIERVKRLVRMLDDSPKSLLNHLVSWANSQENPPR
jgi:hypothetical protein